MSGSQWPSHQESRVLELTFSPEELAELPQVISAPRFATYLKASDNVLPRALALYQWNVEMSAALTIPIHVCEVGIRNVVVDAIEQVHGPNWQKSDGFINSLPQPRLLQHYNPQINLRAMAGRSLTAGQVVAQLNFAFWEQLFTKGQDKRLWDRHLHRVLPGVPPAIDVRTARAAAFSALQSIRRLLNRTAHHEPIFARDLQSDYRLLLQVIGWRSRAAAAWVDRPRRFASLLQQRP